jgi:predicted DNA-binding transcriptional regulator AlpA
LTYRNSFTSGSADSALLLSDNTAAAWLGISRATFWRRVADGTLPRPIRLGGATRWRQDELLLAVERASAKRDADAQR